MSRTLIAIFESRQKLMTAVEKLAQSETIQIERTAVVAKSNEGETILVDNHLKPNEGGRAGGTMGAAVGILGMAQIVPGVGLLGAVGAGMIMGGIVGRQTGRFVTHLIRHSLTDDAVSDIAQSLEDGQAALVVEVPNEQAFGRLSEELYKLNVEAIERVAIV